MSLAKRHNNESLSKLESLEQRHEAVLVSPKYQLISTTRVLEQLSPLVDLSEATVRTYRTSTAHEVVIPIKGHASAFIGPDEVLPRLHVFNSYNGHGTFMIAFGMLRLVCLNGLVVGTNLWAARARHVQGPRINAILDSIQHQVFSADIADIMGQVEALRQVELEPRQIDVFISSLKLSPGLSLMLAHAVTLVNRDADRGNNAWLVYNRIQEALVGGKRTMIARERNKNLMGQMIDFVGGKTA